LRKWVQHIPCGIVEIAFHTSHLSGLISFTPHFQLDAILVVTSDEGNKRLSAMVRVQWLGWG